MKIAVHIQPMGSYLALPKKYGTENSHLWERPPVLVIDVHTNNVELERTVVSLVEKEWNNEGSVGNVVVDILTQVFTEGVRFGMEKALQKIKEKAAGEGINIG